MKFGCRLTSVATEIQDGHKFLLVSLTIDGGTTVVDALKMLEVISGEVSRKVPPREDDYSWMVNIKYAEKILRSASGGWKGRPDL